MREHWSISRFRSGFARNTLILVSGSVAGQMIALLAYPVITRLYSPTDFGIQSIFMTLGLLLSAVATGRYEQALLLPKEDEKASRLMILILLLATGFILLLMIPCVLWNDQLAAILGSAELARWLPWLPLYTLVLGLSTAWTLFANRFSGFRMMSSYQIVQSGSTAGLRIGLSGFGSGGLISGTLIGQLTGMLFLGTPYIRKIRPGAGTSSGQIMEAGKEYSNFPRFKMPGVFITFLSGNLPILALSGFFSPAISGLYALAYTTVFRPMNLFVNSVAQVFAQQFIQHHNELRILEPELKKYLRRMLIIGGVPFLVVFAIAPWLFSLIFGPEWTQAGSYLRWMLPWLFLIFLISGINFIPDMFGKQKKAMIIEIVILSLRIVALATGIILHNADLAILLFCLCGLIVPSYQLMWYIRLVKDYDNRIR
ncbi:MAG: lipopolysaccharide biosynthesis protein [Bacteroidales bacterium]